MAIIHKWNFKAVIDDGDPNRLFHIALILDEVRWNTHSKI